MGGIEFFKGLSVEDRVGEGHRDEDITARGPEESAERGGATDGGQSKEPFDHAYFEFGGFRGKKKGERREKELR